MLLHNCVSYGTNVLFFADLLLRLLHFRQKSRRRNESDGGFLHYCFANCRSCGGLDKHLCAHMSRFSLDRRNCSRRLNRATAKLIDLFYLHKHMWYTSTDLSHFAGIISTQNAQCGEYIKKKLFCRI